VDNRKARFVFAFSRKFCDPIGANLRNRFNSLFWAVRVSTVSCQSAINDNHVMN